MSLATAEESVRYFRRALKLSPQDPLAHDFEGAVATALHLAGRYEEALLMTRQSMASQRDAGLSYEPVVAASLARLGRLDEAAVAARELRARFPKGSLEPARIFAADEVIDFLQEGLELAGF